MDGPGSGSAESSDTARSTLELALRSNGYALWYLATRWVVAGPLGTLLAFAGGRRAGHAALAVGATRAGGGDSGVEPLTERRFERTAGLLLSPVSSSPSSSGTSSSGDEQPPRDALGPDQRAGRRGFRTVLPLRSPRPAVDLRWRRRRRRRPGLSRLRVARRLSGHARICAGDRRRGRGTRALRRSARCRGCGRGPARSARGIRRQVRGGLRADRVRVVRRRPRVRPPPVRRVAPTPVSVAPERSRAGRGRSCTRSTATRPRISR